MSVRSPEVAVPSEGVTDEEFAEWEQVAEAIVAQALAPFGLGGEDHDILAAIFVSDLLFDERFADAMKQLVRDARLSSGSELVGRLPSPLEERLTAELAAEPRIASVGAAGKRAKDE